MSSVFSDLSAASTDQKQRTYIKQTGDYIPMEIDKITTGIMGI